MLRMIRLLALFACTAAFVRAVPPRTYQQLRVHRSGALPRSGSQLTGALTTGYLDSEDVPAILDEDMPSIQSDLPQVMSIRGGHVTLSPTKVTLLGAVVNVLLSLLKLVVGTISGSTSLVADAYHSGSDLIVDAVTMAAVHAPPAFERAATVAIGGLLASAGGAMVWGSCQALWRRSLPTTMLGIPPLIVAVVAIAAKEALFRITRAVAMRTQQAVLLASAKHHRADAMSSFAAALGAVGVLVGLPVADMLAAAVVGGMMFSMGVEVARGQH